MSLSDFFSSSILDKHTKPGHLHKIFLRIFTLIKKVHEFYFIHLFQKIHIQIKDHVKQTRFFWLPSLMAEGDTYCENGNILYSDYDE